MLYANYVRNKMRHLYKTAEAEGVPCVLEYSKGKYMKDYEIYGNSMQGKNLIPYPFYQETKTINGVTFTNNGDGTITANGTATANAVYYLYYNSTEQTRMNISDIAIISGCPKSETTNYGVSFDIYYEDGSRHYYTDYGYSDTPNISTEKGRLNSCYILVKNGVTVENLIFKPQLELGSTATEWQSPAVSPENPVEIYSVGDLTKNLLPYPYSDSTKTLYGITFTDNNGVITLDGTTTLSETGVVDFRLMFNAKLEAGTYTLSGCPKTGGTYTYRLFVNIAHDDNTNTYVNEIGNGSTFTVTNTDLVTINIRIGGQLGTVSNLVFKPQLEKGSSATEYEPYNKYDIPITVEGKNLLPYPYISTTKTTNGVTFTDNGDGSITVNGTATANAVFYLVDKQNNYTLDKCGLKIGDSYTISKTSISGDDLANIYFTANYYDENNTMKPGEVASSRNTATATIKSDFKSWGIYLVVLKDKTVNNTTIKVQLEKGSSATEYEPYRGIETTHIYLDEPLRKVGDYSDYVDFKKQKVVRNVRSEDMGELNYQYYSSDEAHPYGYFVARSINSTDFRLPNSKVVCEIYNSSVISFKTDKTIFSTSTSGIYIVDSDYTSGDDIKNAVTGQKIYIIRATPTEEPISLPTLQTFKDTTIMSVDTTVLPSNIKATYIRT